jgi:membrane protease YdiL (CAAX protease family)
VLRVNAPSAARELSPSRGVLIWLLSLVLVLLAAVAMTLIAFGGALLSGLSVSSAADLLFGNSAASPLISSPPWILAAIAVNELAVLSAVWLGVRRAGVGLADVLPRPQTSREKLIASVLFVAGLAPLAQLAAELASQALEQRPFSDEVVRTLGQETNLPTFLVALAFVALLPGLCEEALFRGFLMRCFERLGVVLNVLVASFLFSLLHLQPSQIAGTFVLGIGFGVIRQATGSVTPCMLAHALYNAAVMTGVRLSPGAGTLEVSPALVALGLVISAVAAWRLRRVDAST